MNGIGMFKLSKSGFTGLWDFQDSHGARLLTGGSAFVFGFAGFSVMAKRVVGRGEILKIPQIP